MSPTTVRKQMVGTVVSDKMTNTLVVRVIRLVRHPIYQRVTKRAKRFQVHNPGVKTQIGDEVRIEETRPISKNKCWRIVEVVRHSPELAE